MRAVRFDLVRRLGWGIGIGAVLLAVAGCGSSGSKTVAASKNCVPKYHFKTHAGGKLTVSIIEFPPYAGLSPGSTNPTGVDGALVKGFAQAACLSLAASPTTFASAVTNVTSNRADLTAGGLDRTAKRAEVVGLSDANYLDEVAIASKAGYSTISSLIGKRVGIPEGVYEQAASQKLFGSKLSLFPDDATLFEALKSGRIDAAIESYVPSKEYLAKLGITSYKVQVPPFDSRIPGTGKDAPTTGWAYPKTNTALGDAINAYVESIRKSGQLRAILVQNGFPASSAEPSSNHLI